VKRECYTLGSVEGQSKETFGVRSGSAPKLAQIVVAGRSDFGKCVHDPCGLVPFSSVRDGREVRRIGFDEQLLSWDQSEKIVVAPFPERHDATEGDAPAGIYRELRQRVRARVAVQHTQDAGASSFADERARVILGIAGVDNNRPVFLPGERELSRERGALRLTRGVVVVVVEAALADRHRAISEALAEPRDVALGIKRGSIVRVDARRPEHESRIGGGVPGGGGRRFE
jgi:hypothetical protein